MGHRVMVIEKKEKIEGKICCTGIISQECVDSFSIKDDLILRRTNNARLIAPSGQSIQLNRKDPQACIVDRARFDIALTEMAQKEGVEYVQGSQVKNIVILSDCVKVESATVGRELDFEARAVVLAAGFGTGLTQKLGLGKGPRTFSAPLN